MIAAWTAGRHAPVRAPNPHYGQGLLARMWRAGYNAMLADLMARSPARQRYLAREAVIAEFVERNGFRPAAVDRPGGSV